MSIPEQGTSPHPPPTAGFGPPILHTQGKHFKERGNIGIFGSAVVRLVRDLSSDTGGLEA